MTISLFRTPVHACVGSDQWLLEHFSVDLPKERARRQYEQYGKREATQGKSLKNSLTSWINRRCAHIHRRCSRMSDTGTIFNTAELTRHGAANRPQPDKAIQSINPKLNFFIFHIFINEPLPALPSAPDAPR